ncbi:MAG: RsmD family RNA methyltransferase [Thermoprotei archaeon]
MLILLQYGDNPTLSRAEATSLASDYGWTIVREAETHLVLENGRPPERGYRFGSLLRMCELFTETTIRDPLLDPKPLFEYTDRAVRWSLYPINVDSSIQSHVESLIVRAIRGSGRKSLFIKPTSTGSHGGGLSVTRAQRNLASQAESAFEFVLEACDDTLYVWRTLSWLDLKGFKERDTLRPAQDSSISMPPALARTLINVAGGRRILDPFCGTGTVLVEAVHAGLCATGVDLDPSRVRMASSNLEWASRKFGSRCCNVFQGDSRRLEQILGQESYDAVVSEPPFGPPLRSRLEPQAARRLLEELRPLYVEVLRSCTRFLSNGGRAVMTLPRFLTTRGELGFEDVSSIGSEAHLKWDSSRAGTSPPRWDTGGWIERDIGVWRR